MQTSKRHINPVMAGASVMFALFFMAVTSVKALVNKTVALDDIIIVLLLMIATESGWYLFKILRARIGTK